MNSIDSLNSALFFTASSVAAKEAQKEQQKSKIDKTKKSAFAMAVEKNQEINELVEAGLPAEIAGLSTEEAVIYLKDQIDLAGDELLEKMDMNSFHRFKKSVSNMMKYLEKYNYKIKVVKRKGIVQSRGTFGPFFNELHERNPYVQVRVIDEKLDHVASEILKSHIDKLQMLAKIDEIKGLVVDFFAA